MTRGFLSYLRSLHLFFYSLLCKLFKQTASFEPLSMKFLTFFFLLFVNAICASEEKVYCERIAGYHIEVPEGTQKTCFMSNTTSIDSHGFVLGSDKDETIKWISFSVNKKIEYLPVQISVKFPNLTCYMAYRCSIKAISRDNFRELSQLTLLYLYSNQIEEIKSDTFSDLKKLSVLLLGECTNE
jgi:hypothetical protein